MAQHAPNMFKKIGLTKKISIIFILIVVVLITIVSTSLYGYFRKNTKASLINSLKLVIENNASSVNDLFSRIDIAVDIINGDSSNLLPSLNNYDGDLFKGVRSYNYVKQQIKNNIDITIKPISSYYQASLFVDDSMKLSSILSSVYIDGIFTTDYGSNSAGVYSNSNVHEQDWYKKATELNGGYYWFKYPGDDKTLYVARELKQSIYDNKVTTNTIGVILIELDASWIKGKIDTSQLTQNTNVFCLDSDMNVIYSENHQHEQQGFNNIIGNLDQISDEGQFTEVELQGKINLMHTIPLDQNLTIVTMIPIYDIELLASGSLLTVVLLSLAVVLTGLLLIIAVSQAVVKPIKALCFHMENNDNLALIPMTKNSSGEVGTLYNSFNNLMNRVNKLIQEVHFSTQIQKKSELKALQAQINPHFVYNTLDSVCCCALIAGEEKIADALTSLTAMMRYNINNPEGMASLSEEFDTINNYIQLQTLHFGNCLELDYDIDLDCENILIPKMIIQPLIENCITHGKTSDDGSIKISITCETDSDVLSIIICDSGHCEDIQAINDHLKGLKDIGRRNGGLRIRNVQERIHLNFGENYGLKYTHSENNETCVTVRVPLTYTE